MTSSPGIHLIGDVVRSRASPDRRALHDRLVTVLGEVDASAPSVTGLAVTVGDEFQGSYHRLGEAVHARTAIQMLLAPAVQVRFGIGRGPVQVLDPVTGTQDGPGWWAARAAIEEVKAQAREVGHERTRTAYRTSDAAADDAGAREARSTGEAGSTGDEDAVNAALVCQDLVLGSLDSTEWTIVRGLMQGHTQQQIADGLGLTRQAVHARRKAGALPMLLDSLRRLEQAP